MSIHVTDFKYEKGKNEVKYIELLEKTLKNEQRVTALAVAKVRKLAKENQEIRAKAIDEFVKEIETEYDNDGCPNVSDYLDYKISIRDLQKIAEHLKGGAE